MQAIIPFLLYFLLSSVALGHQFSFMPPNTLDRDEADSVQESNVSEDDFNQVLDQVETLYGVMIPQIFGARLNLERDWASPTVNAYADQVGNTWTVHMYGGLARRPEITRDGFTLVACHELGHHLAGYPGIDWAANEGNSDYYSATACARTLWLFEHAENARAAKTVNRLAQIKCDLAWPVGPDDFNLSNRNLCYRVAMAGKSLADLLSENTASFATPDLSRVRRTYNGHPNGQCRLDTYLAGALCTASWRMSVIAQSRSQMQGCLLGASARPACWFR